MGENFPRDLVGRMSCIVNTGLQSRALLDRLWFQPFALTLDGRDKSSSN